MSNLIPHNSQIIIYRNNNGEIKLDVRFDGDTVWLTQKMMAELFDVEVNTINYHLKEIFKTAELNENSVIRKIRITANDGKNYETNLYNLDAIISVGYRVNSVRATQKLKEYIVKGFVLDACVEICQEKMMY